MLLVCVAGSVCERALPAAAVLGYAVSSGRPGWAVLLVAAAPIASGSEVPGVFDTRTELKAAVDEWIADATAAEATHGHISGWDVSRVDDLSELFAGTCDSPSTCGCHMWQCLTPSLFNDDISAWDTAKATITTKMFARATSFDQAIGGWDMSKIATT